MGRFLFVGLDTGGTWKPTLGLAPMLVRRGHAATVLGSPSMRATTLAAGCSFLPLPAELDFDDILPHTGLLVTHGGMATTTAALAHGVPMLVMEIARGRPYLLGV